MNILWALVLTQSILTTNGNKSPSFQDLKKEKYFIDKSMFLRDVLTDDNNVISISAPNGFGKSSILSMTAEFLEIVMDESGKEAKDKSNSDKYRTFTGKDLKIARDKHFVDQYLGQYPVIRVDLQNVKGSTTDSVMRKLQQEVSRIFGEYAFLLKSMKNRLDYCNKVIHDPSSVPKEDLARLETEELVLSNEVPYFEKFINVSQETDNYNVYHALKFLCKQLFNHFQKKVYVLVDEFDAPIISALQINLDADIVNGHIENFLVGIVKAKQYVERVIFMGVLNIAHASASGLDTIKPYTFLENAYSKYFGYTDSEVSTLLKRFGVPAEEAEKVKDYYNGYSATLNDKSLTIYNPLSINGYLKTGLIKNHWIKTESPNFLQNALYNVQTEIYFHALVRHQEPISITYDESMSMETVGDALRKLYGFNNRGFNYSPLFSCLFRLGYLTKVKSTDDQFSAFQLPNKEVKEAFEEQMKHFFRIKYTADLNDLKMVSNVINCLLARSEASVNESTKKLEEALLTMAKKTTNRTNTGSQVLEVLTNKEYYYTILKTAVTLGVHFKEFTPECTLYSKSEAPDRPVLVIRNNTGTSDKHVAVAMDLRDEDNKPESKLDVERYLIENFDKRFVEKLTVRYIDINVQYKTASPMVKVGHRITSIKSNRSNV